MSEQPAAVAVPEWDLADRMRKSLRHAGIAPGEMAVYLDVGGNTVSTWINGRIKPSKQTLRLWAMRCGVNFDWLCHGDHEPCATSPTRPVSAGQARIITGRYRTMPPAAPFSPAFLPAAA